jgi:superfamily II DNA or RNA helicase
MGKKARRVVVDKLAEPGLRGAVLVATSGLIGEGFDCPALDTVFLASLFHATAGVTGEADVVGVEVAGKRW